MLGPAGYGIVGIIMSFASTVNGLLSFRMGELVVRYGGKYLEENQKQRAAAVIRAAALAEAAVSVFAFLVLLLTAGIAARYFAKTPGIEWLVMVYGLGLLSNFNVETATGVLQITDRIKRRGVVNLVQSILSAAIIVVLFAWNSRAPFDPEKALVGVLLAYLLGKVVLGAGLFAAAWSELRQIMGRGWHRESFASLPSLRELFGFAVSSNLSATAILVFRESELLWVGLFLNSEAAGLYKVAYTIVSLLAIPADPLILSVYPETNRLVVQRAWRRLRDFLRKVTTLSLAYNLLLALGLAVFGRWILAVFGEQYTVAYPAMMALLVGLVFNYTLFWNRPILLSFGLQTFALGAVLLAGAIKVGLAIPLVPRYGYVMEAALLSGYYVVSVGLIVWRGLTEVNRRSVHVARGRG
jgi:O-antigen/teichoic acid export membrane protein